MKTETLMKQRKKFVELEPVLAKSVNVGYLNKILFQEHYQGYQKNKIFKISFVLLIHF